jgi:PhnB protein
MLARAHLIVPARERSKALHFCQRAFGAHQDLALTGPDGAPIHAEMCIGAAAIMLGAEHRDRIFGPRHDGGAPVSLFVYAPDIAAFAARAVAAGAQ